MTLTTTVATIGLAASLVVTALAPRALDTQDLALFFAVTSAVAVAGQLGALSLPELVMRQAARPGDGIEPPAIVAACLRALAVAGIVTSLMMGDALGTAGLLLLAWVPLAGLGRLTAVVVRLQGSDVLGSSIGEVARRLGMAVGLVMVWRSGGGWEVVALAGMLAELVLLAIGSRRATPGLDLSGWRRQSLPTTLGIWRRGGVHALAGLPRLIITAAGPLVLTVRLGQSGAQETTELGMVVRLTAVGGLLTVACTRALAAWAVRAAVDESARLEHRQRVRRWSLALMVLSILPAALAVSPEFTTFVFGDQGRLISPWTALATGLAVGFVSGGALRYQELVVNLGPERIWRSSVAVAVIWSMSALALARPFGAAGVAASSAVCSFLLFVVLVVAGHRHLPAVPRLDGSTV